MNVLKYTVFGGYSDYKILFGDISKQIESLTYQTVNKNFISVGLIKYFVINVNFPLIMPIVALVVYTLCLLRKIRKRAQYIQTHQQSDKDSYTAMKRSAKWVYDHCVFPLVNLFSMIVFFSTIL